MCGFMTDLLYLQDSYLREFDARVAAVNGRHIFLDRTAFYPSGGGVPSDKGVIERADRARFNVVNVAKARDGVCHEVDREGLAVGDAVHCVLDWERRYRLMRMHTAAHVLSAIFHRRAGVLITGNQLGIEDSRMDFSLEDFDRKQMEAVCAEANALIRAGAAVKIYSLPRDEAMKLPGIVKLAGALPPNIEMLRIVEIVGVDAQADGGPHVTNLSEIGTVEIVKLENKGRVNRRVYFTVKP
jgi:Ser-tRNA(Ala) deacylase AlaX